LRVLGGGRTWLNSPRRTGTWLVALDGQGTWSGSPERSRHDPRSLWTLTYGLGPPWVLGCGLGSTCMLGYDLASLRGGLDPLGC
jgi:hypothetical protein